MVSAIELESFARIQREVDFTHLGRDAAEIAARIIHATGDTGIIADLTIDEEAIQRSVWGIQHEVPIVVDVRMLAAGLSNLRSFVAIDASGDPTDAIDQAVPPSARTRSYRGMSVLLHKLAGTSPIIAIGSAPTALRAVLAHVEETAPLAVIGMPVGFVDAVESKAALRASGIPAITSISRRGGSSMAAAALNALALVAHGEYRLGS
ncbi:precorrin-8X methylmutase [Ferrimicrobium sp.]|uniref:precorrin-8X methylmutase n=1 Tax=Ferrimicrobium sp. TaxID=2926050 RepID=UPI00260AB311|nr:precorrin-8X methylmutase [Ferrimicrobium sp.]